MSNMSYCRFRNTLNDLEDCYEAIQGNYEEEDQELSPEEEQAKTRLIELCREITNNINLQ